MGYRYILMCHQSCIFQIYHKFTFISLSLLAPRIKENGLEDSAMMDGHWKNTVSGKRF